jgi:rubrerythrin
VDKKTIEARIRQIAAVDRNAMDIYLELAHNVSDSEIQKQLLFLSEDEKRHIQMLNAALSLLESC